MGSGRDARRRRALVLFRTTILPWPVGWPWETQRKRGAVLRAGAAWVWVGVGCGLVRGRVVAGLSVLV